MRRWLEMWLDSPNLSILNKSVEKFELGLNKSLLETLDQKLVQWRSRGSGEVNQGTSFGRFTKKRYKIPYKIIYKRVLWAKNTWTPLLQTTLSLKSKIIQNVHLGLNRNLIQCLEWVANKLAKLIENETLIECLEYKRQSHPELTVNS